jgi:hypothetical protein
MKQDKQPRRPSKDVSLDKLHPASDMGKRAKGGDKFSNAHGLPRPMKGDASKGSPSTKSR